MIPRAIDCGSAGSQSTAAPPAISGIAVTFDVTTGRARHRLEDRSRTSRRATGTRSRRPLMKRTVSSSGTPPIQTTSSLIPMSGERVQLSGVLRIARMADDGQLAIPELTAGQLPRPQ